MCIFIEVPSSSSQLFAVLSQQTLKHCIEKLSTFNKSVTKNINGREERKQQVSLCVPVGGRASELPEVNSSQHLLSAHSVLGTKQGTTSFLSAITL